MDIRTINFILENSCKQEWECVAENTVFLKNDVLLHINYEYDGPIQTSTGALFPNQLPNARRVICKVLYSSSVIEELVLISVDNGRAFLPVPKGLTTTVTKHDGSIAYLLSNGNIDDYLQKAGVKIV